MCKFENKEVCESLCFHIKSGRTGLRKLVVWDAVCGAVSVRLRCGLGPGLARDRSNSGHSFSMFVSVVTLGEARHDCFSQCNAGADVVQAHMWCVVTLGEARHDCFSNGNAGADVVQAHMWCVVRLGVARRDCFPPCNAGADVVQAHM